MKISPRHQSVYLVSIWVEDTQAHRPLWRGALVTPAHQRLYFGSMRELQHLLLELTGWQDPPMPDDVASTEETN
jgi:hypothetical protein